MNGKAKARAAFLDRDGVINVDTGYVNSVAEFRFIPGVLDACRDLHRAHYKLIVVTNQAGIAHGYYEEQAFRDITSWMRQRFAEAEAPLTDVYHCPHHPNGKIARFAGNCDCRKPAPGLILQAVRDHGVDPSRSFLVGDKESDIDAAISARIAGRYLIRPSGPYRSLADVAREILKPR